jgi:hypothetical protein
MPATEWTRPTADLHRVRRFRVVERPSVAAGAAVAGGAAGEDPGRYHDHEDPPHATELPTHIDLLVPVIGQDCIVGESAPFA